MRVTESIKQLRQICQRSREETGYRMPWVERNFGRKISIYLTKLFLQIGFSANQVSFIGFVLTVAGGVLLIFPGSGYWLIGIALLLLCEVLGMVDGEVARYTKTASPTGAFWNVMPEQFSWLYTPICISFGIYHTFHSIYPLVLGFLAVMSFSLTGFALLLPYPILREKGLLSEALATSKATRSEEHTSIIIRYGRLLNHFTVLLLTFLTCTITDFFISPFTIGFLSFNARYICFIFFTAVLLASAIWNIYPILRGETKLRL